MYNTRFRSSRILLLLVCAVSNLIFVEWHPAIAQVPVSGHVARHTTSTSMVAISPPWQILFHDMVFLTWLFGSLIIAWGFSVILSLGLIKSRFYPPNAARFACWLAVSLWGLFFAFILFGHLFPYFLPSWFATSLLLFLFIAGVIALITRRQPI